MDLKATILKLSELTSYQDGSVISRQVIKKETGNVTVFAFDKGEGLSEHTAPFDALVYCIEGKVQITISEKVYVLGAGEMIIMPANEPHSVHALEKFKMMLVMIK